MTNHSAMDDIIRDSDPTELPGVRKKSFAMFFGGGEIWFEHLDGMYDNESLVLAKLEGDRRSFRKPSGTSLLCIVLDETVVTDKIADALVNELRNGSKRFTRVAFVGLDRRMKRSFSRSLDGAGFALYFDGDLERAKEWLVSEIY